MIKRLRLKLQDVPGRSVFGWVYLAAGRGKSPGIQLKLRGKVYCKGQCEKGNNTEERLPLGIKGNNTS